MNSGILERFANSSDEEEGEVQLGPRPRIANPVMATFISQMFSEEIFLMQLLKQKKKEDNDDMKKKEFYLLKCNQEKKSGMVKS